MGKRAAGVLIAILLLSCSDKTDATGDPPSTGDAGPIDPGACAPGASCAAAAAPTFAGVAAVAPASPTALFVSWPLASDPVTPQAELLYRVYLGAAAGSVDFAHPVAISRPGEQGVVVTGLTPGHPYAVVVRAINKAEKEDTNVTTLTGTPLSDALGPAFRGIADAQVAADGSVTLSWAAAVDDLTPAGAIVYQLFATDSPTMFEAKPPLESPPGATSARLAGPFAKGRHWFFRVRARDAAGHVDANEVTLARGFDGDDTTPPTFKGLENAVVDPNARTVTLSWSAASDDRTPPEKIVYEIYEARGVAAYDYTAPRRVAPVGATSHVMTDLPGDASLRWVVRARDLASNAETNVIERSGTTNPGFKSDIQPIFSYNCAVVGCHVPGNPPLGLILASGFAYAQTVNTDAGEFALKRIAPGASDASFLYKKMTGTATVGNRMPAPATGNVLSTADIDRVRRWIDNGALDN